MIKKLKDVTIEELVNTCSKNCSVVCEDTHKCPFKDIGICFLRWKNFKNRLNKELKL